MKASTIQTFRRFSATPKGMGVIGRSSARAFGESRHLAWAMTLVERLLRRVLLGAMRFESMVLLRPAQAWIQRLQVLRTGGASTALPESQEWKSFHSHQSTIWLAAASQTLRSERTLERVSRYVASPALAQTYALSGRRGELPGSHGLSLQENAILRRRMHFTHERTASSLLVRRAGADSYTAIRSVPLSADARSLNGPDRILRQHRRLEDQSMAIASVDKGQMCGPFSDVPAIAERSRPPVNFLNKAVSHVEKREAVPQPGATVNVAQITDAVLKQIDRRLVAARERMGKI